MKKSILILLTVFSLTTTTHGQNYGWQKINTESISGYYDFTDVFFTDANTGWITTNTEDKIFKTTDGGENFEVQTTPLGATLAIHMLDPVNGYSGGQGGWVYKTANGGDNWNVLATMGSLTDISFPFNTNPDDPVGYACGDAGRVWKITATLTDLNSSGASNFAGISAPSVDNVWVCGGNRIYYYNGTDFTSQIAPPGTFNDVHFINNQEGWVIGDSGRLGYTTDGGTSWNTQTNPDTQNRSLYGVFFFDSDYGWAVGNNGIILHTSDGGSNWAIVGEGHTTEALSCIHFTSATNGYVVGNGKTLLKYGEILGVGDEIQNIEFELFPNPAKDKCKVQRKKAKGENASIEIFDLNGRLLLKKQILAGSKNIEIDVSHLASGVYFCTLRTDKKSVLKN